MRFTIVTYNMRGELWSKEQSADFAQLIKEHEVDVVCLQEVVEDQGMKKGQEVTQVEELKDRLGGHYGSIEFLAVQSPKKSSGNVILYNKANIFPSGREFTKRYALLSHRSVLEELISRYLAPFRKLILSQKFKVGSNVLIIYNAHLDFYGGELNKVFQFRDFFRLWEAERRKGGLIELLVGDLNTWLPYKMLKWFRPISILRRFLHISGFRDLIEDVNWTQWGDFTEAEKIAEKYWLTKSFWYKFMSKYDHVLKQKLDHAWGKGDFKLLSSRCLGFTGSDHFPVLVELDI